MPHVFTAWVLHPGQADEGIKSWQAHTYGNVGIRSLRLSPRLLASSPGKFGVYIIYSWTGRWGHFIQLNKRQVWLILVGTLSGEGQSSGHKYLQGESYGGHFLPTLSVFAFESEKGFAILLKFTRGRLCRSIELRHRGLWHRRAHINNPHSFRISLILQNCNRKVFQNSSSTFVLPETKSMCMVLTLITFNWIASFIIREGYQVIGGYSMIMWDVWELVVVILWMWST